MLARKVLLWFFAPLLVVLLGAELLVYGMATARLRSEVDHSLQVTAGALDAEIAAVVRSISDDLDVIAAHAAFGQYFPLLRFGQPVAADAKLIDVQTHFVSVAGLKPACSTIRFHDAGGRVLTAVVGGERDFVANDVAGERWFRETLRLDESGTHVEGRGAALILARPLFWAGEPRGVLSIEAAVRDLFGELIRRPVGRKGYACLIEPAGTVVLHQDPAEQGVDVSGAHATRRALAGYAGLTSVAGETGESRLRQAFRPLQACDLALVVAVPEAEIYAPVDELLMTVLPVTLGGVLALALFGVYLVRRVIAPIRHLTEVTARVGRGDLEAESRVNTGDEIEELSHGFNRMTRSLKANRASIERQNEVLTATAEALRKSEENLRITLASIGDGVIATDCDARITSMNPRAEELTGFSLAEMRGRTLTDAFRLIQRDTREPIEDPVARVLRTGEIVGLANHAVLVARDRTERQILESGAPIRDGHQEIVGVVLVFRDVTERYRMEQQLHQAQKMESIGKLAGGVAHDFNNLLTAVQGNAELLREELRSEGRREEGLSMVEAVLAATQRAAELVSQLLTFARRQPLTTAVLDLHQVVDDTIAMASRTFDKGIDIRRDLGAPDATVLGERSTLESALLNLAINARDAMPDGGVLTFRTRRVEVGEDDCRRPGAELRPGPHVLLEIVDTGEGMDAATQERIFEPFFTTKAVGKGTGLGLAMTYGTIVSHHGAIEVESAVGAGTTMRVLLPVAHEAVPPGDDEPAPPVVHGAGSVLVVDDEPAVLASTVAMLERLGYTAQAAVSGARAVELFAAASFDLVLLDMIMPAQGGAEVMARLRAIRPDVPVLLTSGHSEGAAVEKAMRLGASGLLRKPFGLPELSRRVAQARRHRTSENR